MSQPADFSSELQRKFAEASRLRSPAEVLEYLQRECGQDAQEKELLLKMLGPSGEASENPLLQADKRLSELAELAEVVGDAASFQQFPSDDLAIFPEVSGYKLIKALGEGAMGTVYLAEQLEPIRRRVALKVIKPGMDSKQVLARFEREKQTLALLEHPNICEVYDAGLTAREYPFFSMEVVDGETIDQYCSSHSLSLEARIRLVLDVCKAAHHAHNRGIIHRDLKPANVLVKTIDGVPVVKVIDFGVAKAMQADGSQAAYETYFRQLVGTPMYMSPEQLEPGETVIDERSDVYSLGGLLFKLVTGFAPLHQFDSEDLSLESLRRRIVLDVPPRASQKISAAIRQSPKIIARRLGIKVGQLAGWRKRSRGDLELVLMIALEKRPSDRYASALALAEDLQSVIDRIPIAGKGMSQLRMWRRRALKPLLVATLLLAIVSAVTFFYDKSMVAREDKPASDQDALAASAAESSTVSDLLEARRLQLMIKAWEERDLYSLEQIVRSQPSASGSGGEQVGQGDAGNGLQDSEKNQGPSLVRFLESLASPEPLLELQNGSSVNDFSVSPDGRFLAAACDDRFARIWSLENGRLLGELGPHAGKVTATLFSGDGELLLTGDQEGVLTIRDARPLLGNYQGGALPILYRSEPNQEGGVESLACSPDGQLIAIGFRYEPVVVVDLQGNEVASFPFPEPEARNESVLFLKNDSELMLTNRSALRLERYDLTSKQLTWHSEIDPVFAAGNGAYPRLFSICNGIVLYSRHGSAAIEQIDFQTGKRLEPLLAATGGTMDFAVSANGAHLATAHSGGQIGFSTLRIHESDGAFEASDHWLHACHLTDDPLATTKVEFFGEDHLLTAAEDGRVCLWSVDDLAVVKEFEENSTAVKYIGRNGSILGLHFSNDSTRAEYIAGGVQEGTIHHYELPPCSILPSHPAYNNQFPRYHFHSPFALGEAVGVSAMPVEEGVGIFEMATGEQVGIIRVDSEIPFQLAFSRDGEFLIARNFERAWVWKSQNRWAEASLIASLDLRPFPQLPIDSGSICIIESGKSVAFRYDSEVIVVGAETGQVVERYPLAGERFFVFSANERLVFLSREVGAVVVDRMTRAETPVISSMRLGGAQFIEDDRVILLENSDASLEAFHLPTQSRLGKIYAKNQDTGGIVTFKLTDQSSLEVIKMHSTSIVVHHSIGGDRKK
ncbi:protein kinase domain-containing protein [Planctomycetaceae bacterium SH139]